MHFFFTSRYKDSISKGTQGFREKLLAQNSSVKELSKGVQREMSASIAGVARLIERLDLKSKRSTHPGKVLSHGREASDFFSKGKGVLDHILASSQENHVATGLDLDLHENSQATSSISTHNDLSCAKVCYICSNTSEVKKLVLITTKLFYSMFVQKYILADEIFDD